MKGSGGAAQEAPPERRMVDGKGRHAIRTGELLGTAERHIAATRSATAGYGAPIPIRAEEEALRHFGGEALWKSAQTVLAARQALDEFDKKEPGKIAGLLKKFGHDPHGDEGKNLRDALHAAMERHGLLEGRVRRHPQWSSHIESLHRTEQEVRRKHQDRLVLQTSLITDLERLRASLRGLREDGLWIDVNHLSDPARFTAEVNMAIIEAHASGRVPDFSAAQNEVRAQDPQEVAEEPARPTTPAHSRGELPGQTQEPMPHARSEMTVQVRKARGMAPAIGNLAQAVGTSTDQEAGGGSGGLPRMVVEALFRQPERHSIETLAWLFADETIHRLNDIAQSRQRSADGLIRCPICLTPIDDHDGRVGGFWRDYYARDQRANVSVRRLEGLFCLCLSCAPMLLDAGDAEILQTPGDGLQPRISWFKQHFGLDEAGVEGWLQSQASAEISRSKVEWCFDFTMEAGKEHRDYIVLNGWSAESSKRLIWVTESVRTAVWITGTKFVGAGRNIDPPAPAEFYVDCDLKPKAMGG